MKVYFGCFGQWQKRDAALIIIQFSKIVRLIENRLIMVHSFADITNSSRSYTTNSSVLFLKWKILFRELLIDLREYSPATIPHFSLIICHIDLDVTANRY